MTKQQNKIQYQFNEATAELLLFFALSNSPVVTIASLKKFLSLLKAVDIESYDDNTAAVLLFSKLTIKNRIKNSNTLGVTLTELSTTQYYDYINENVEDYVESANAISDVDLSRIDKFVSEIIKFSFIYNYVDKLEDICVRIKGNDFVSIKSICAEAEDIVTKLTKNFKRIRRMDDEDPEDFDSNDISCFTAVKNSLDQLNDPGHKLRTSIQMKNQMLNGGYEAGRFYLVLGLQGRGKSTELLRIALDVKHYNKDLKMENGVTPVVLFITQENSKRETLERIWNYYYPDDDFKKHSPEDAYEKLCKAGFNNGPNIRIVYRKTKSISTDDVDTMIDSIEEDGDKKVIIVIHDYLKRIRSADYTGGMDMYTELGNITDEFCNIAKSRNIPIVSAMQFNRNAMQIINEAIRKNKTDPLKQISSDNIGESIRIVDNSDVIYSILNVEYDGKPYQSFNLLKMRGNRNDKDSKNVKTAVTYFIHPVEENNPMKLIPDVQSVTSLSKLTMNESENTQFKPSDIRKKLGGRPSISVTRVNEITK